MKKELLAKLLEVSPKSVYNYEKENRAIIRLLKTYFDDQDISEFLETGRISKCEKLSASNEQSALIQKYLVDHALYSVKPKLKELFKAGFLANNMLYTKGARDILIDVLKKITPNDNSFNLENAKDRLTDRISEEELKWYDLDFKKPGKEKLLNSLIKENFSNAEIYAMAKYSNDLVEYLKNI